MSDPAPAPRFTLRALPLAAKLVVTAFLLAVGLGYTSAMVQLHMQHGERDGAALPTPDNVVAVFAGVKRAPADGTAEKVVSKLEQIISGDPKGGLTAKNMTAAFFAEDGADYQKRAEEKPNELAALDAEREGERAAVVAWTNSPAETRKKAYEENKFLLPPALTGKPLTAGYKTNGSAVRIKTLIDDRCVRCHRPDGDKADYPLTTYEDFTKILPAAAPVVKDGWVASGRQISLEKLTQSTHAHLLSFAVLFGLTGIIFAFTGYPGIVRGVVGPGVLVAQVADVSCWWLARLPVEQGGPYFAYAIIGTGAAVGFGLMTQIVLSLFGMYGRVGRVVLVLLFAAALGLGGAVYVKVVRPFLDAEKAAKANGAPKPAPPADKKDKPTPPTSGLSWLEAVMNGEFGQTGWSGKNAGGMVRAFFDKDEEVFKIALKEKAPELPRLTAERAGEQAAVLRWVRLPDDARKKAYEDDALAVPDWNGKPLTAEFRANDTTVKVRSILMKRCAVCHGPGGEKEDIPLTKYEEFARYFQPGPAAGAKAGPAPIPAAND